MFEHVQVGRKAFFEHVQTMLGRFLPVAFRTLGLCLIDRLSFWQDQLEDSVAGYVSEIRPADTCSFMRSVVKGANLSGCRTSTTLCKRG